MSASAISAATARRSRRRPSTRLAARGLRYTGFHTTAMCSTTRAALLTGRNHHSVGMGCLANFDSGYPGYRGKIAREAGTLAEMLRPHGYRTTWSASGM
jgi:arylsulfatase A-like enzyme